MNRTGKVIIGVGLILSALSAIGYLANELNKLYNYCYRLMGVNKINIKNGISCTLKIGVNNKSDLSLQLKSQEYTVSVNGFPVAEVKSPLTTKIRSNRETPIYIDVSVSEKKLKEAGINNIANLLFQKDKIVIRTKGKLEAAAGLLSMKDIPIDVSYTLAELLAPSEDTSCQQKK